MSVACALAFMLVAPATGAAAPATSTTINSDPAMLPAPRGRAAARKQARVREASGHFTARRYPAAAAAYEALFAEFDEPAFLLAAARSRQAAGQHAHTVAYLSQLVASGQLTAADTQVAYGELQAAQRQVTPVTVRVELPAGLGAASPLLTAQFMAHEEHERRPPLEFPLPPGAGAVRVVMLQLDPGEWRLQVDDPGLANIDVLIQVKRQPGEPVRLDLRPPPGSLGLPRRQQLRLVGVLGALGGAGIVTGVGLTVLDEFANVRPTLARPASECVDKLACRHAIADAFTGRSTGASFIGAGAGLLVGGLSGLVRDPRSRRTLWIAELAVGGAGVVGGSFALALAARGFDEHNVVEDRPWGDPAYVQAIDRRGDQHTIAAAGLGLGSGLAFAAAVGLIRTRIHVQRQRLQSRIGVGVGGVTWSGRF